MEEPQLLKDILRDAMAAHDYAIEKLSAATGVAEQFIRTIVHDASYSLPPGTYARGYMNKIARALELDAAELWRTYEREYNPKISGALDMLPKNRFAIATMSKKTVVAIIVSALLALYGIINVDRLWSVPRLVIASPESDVVNTKIPSIRVAGSIQNPQDTIAVNDADIFVGNDGFFEKTVELDPGVNIITIKAKRFLGRETTRTYQVVYAFDDHGTSTVNN